MKRREGPNTKPGLARQHLLDKYSDLPSPDLIQNGHILFLYVTAKSSNTATAREIVKYIPEMTEEQAKNKVKVLVGKTFKKYRKLTNEREYCQFEGICSQRFCENSTTTTVSHAKSPKSAEQQVPKLPLKTTRVSKAKCPTCTRYKESLKNMRQKNLQMQRSKYLAIKKLEAQQRKKGTIRVLNQKLKRKEKQISNLKNLLKSQDAKTIAKLKKQYKVKARSHMRLKKSLTRMKREVKSNSVNDMDRRCCELEERSISMNSEIHDLQLKNHILEEKIQDLESEKKLTKKDAKLYSNKMRLMVFDAISNQVPTANIQNLITKFGLRFSICLSDVPKRATVEAMTREMGALSDLQTAEALLANTHTTLGFDATTQEGIHLNSIHFTTKENCYVVAVDELPGGSAEDYQIHICDSISNLASVYCHFFEADYQNILQQMIGNISNTLTDRCAANHAAIRLVCASWNKSLNELNCNLHPLETIALKTKSALKEIEKSMGITGKTKGKDCIGANIVVQMNKMRYMDGEGDPRGFKVFLDQNNLALGLIPRYRGNRLHILFHICGIFSSHHATLKSYLSGGTSCGGLRDSILEDFNSTAGQVEMQVLGLLGKFLTGPWMTKFYTGADEQTDYIKCIEIIKETVQNLKDQLSSPAEFLTRTTDLFGNQLNASDKILEKLQQPPKDKVMFTQMMESCLRAVILVLERQYQQYFVDTWTVTEKLKQETASARSHNMDAEELMGMFSALKKKAPNATICYLSCKMRARKNNTVDYLDSLDKKKQELVIRKAVRLGVIQRRKRRKKQGELQEELQKRQATNERKRSEQERKVLEKKFEELAADKIEEAFPELPEEKISLIKELLAGRGVGAFICHAWDLGGSRVIFNGKIESFHAKKKKYTVGYWAMSGEGYEFDAHDTDVSIYAMTADVILDDLVVQ
nr:uncharacterized protein LOC129443265 [Misgurnus anguillicaudatus]XP_055059727.1 uncharacterized protein LOC129443265 [Misgurnus anguillicaudatus]XP_055059728.1 uncharacterized protein LOC129443265 [Misgurnus anguillicaudatus]XP_055059729.1 uncharacterized protein LOC129443265 [Misgurnus anguillicaudatus]XP_055059730.1 uncharacterized protein LOC129443265 [Misgurnus anguillicaudatus]XP_055059731.1 uncharacterized protein LOC129443265 [Misgurnus anguillicaudatus]XP_055059732.1 uncharacterize